MSCWVICCAARCRAPNAGKAVGLQLKRHGSRAFFGRILVDKLPLTLLDAEQALDVVTQFVRDDVGLGKVSCGAAELREFVPEAEVDVDFLVFRAVEGPVEACAVPQAEKVWSRKSTSLAWRYWRLLAAKVCSQVRCASSRV